MRQESISESSSSATGCLLMTHLPDESAALLADPTPTVEAWPDAVNQELSEMIDTHNVAAADQIAQFGGDVHGQRLLEAVAGAVNYVAERKYQTGRQVIQGKVERFTAVTYVLIAMDAKLDRLAGGTGESWDAALCAALVDAAGMRDAA
jgi:hypothetical protein